MSSGFWSGYEAFKGNEQQRPILPTLFIGLGGTGMKVLARFRQRMFERFGNEEQWNVFQFLGVDTDQGEIQRGGVDEKNQKGRPINQHDMLFIGLQPMQVDRIIKERRNLYAHIGRWLPEEAVNWGTSNFVTGAQQKRPAGRMLFVYHIERIREMIKARCDKAIGQAATAQALNVGGQMGVVQQQAGSKVDVVIVGSLAGGTGAGSFLDCAYLVRHMGLKGQAAINDIRGMFLLPDVFAGQLPNQEQVRVSHANGYAALRELEYYNGLRPVGRFTTADWAEPRPEFVDDNPLNICYLFSLKNPEPLEDPSEMYDLVADALTFSVGGTQLAQKMRSNWNNAQQAGQVELRYAHAAYEDTGGPEGTDENNPPPNQRGFVMFERSWSRRFASLGIASVTMKLPELRRLASYRLLRRIAAMETGEKMPVETKANEGQINGAGDEILSRRDFLKGVKFVAKSLEDVDRAASAPTAAAAEQHARMILQELRDISTSLTQTDDRAPRNVVKSLWVTADSDAENAARAAVARLTGRSNLYTARYLLTRLGEYLKQRIPDPPELAELKLDDLRPLEQWKDLDRTGADDFLSLGLRARRIITAKFKDWLLVERQRLIDRMNQVLYQRYLMGVEQRLRVVLADVESRIKRLQDWAGHFQDLQNKLARHFKETRNEVVPDALALAAPSDDPAKERDLDAATEKALARGLNFKPEERVAAEDLLTRARGRILEPADGGTQRAAQTLADHLGAPEDAPRGTVEVLADRVTALLDQLPEEQDVFAILNRKGTLNKTLTAVMKRAAPYWHFNPAYEDIKSGIHTISMVGAVFSPQPTGPQEDARRLFENNQPKYMVLTSGPNTPGASPGEVIVVNEGYGYGLASLQTLEEMKRAYDQIVADGKMAERYLDKRVRSRLPELLQPTYDEARAEALSWDRALLGIILGAFQWNDSKMTYQFSPDGFTQYDVGTDYTEIAQWLRSVEGQQHAEAIRSEIDQYFRSCLNDPLREADPAVRQQIVAEKCVELKRLDLLLDLLERHVFPREDFGDGNYRQSPQNTLVVRLRRMFPKKYLASLRNQFGQEVPDDGRLRELVDPELHKWVRFVGGRNGGGGSAKRDGAGHGTTNPRRILSLQFQGALPDDQAKQVLHEAWNLNWFKHDQFPDPEVLPSLFPESRAFRRGIGAARPAGSN